MRGNLTFYSLVVREKQHDKAEASGILDFPGQNTPNKLVEIKLHSEKTTMVDERLVALRLAIAVVRKLDQ